MPDQSPIKSDAGEKKKVRTAPSIPPVHDVDVPPWICYTSAQAGVSRVAETETVDEPHSPTGTHRIEDPRIDDRIYDKNASAHFTMDQYVSNGLTMSQNVTIGPLTHAPAKLRSQVSEPALTWAERLPDRPFNGMPNPATDVNKPGLRIDTEEHETPLTLPLFVNVSSPKARSLVTVLCSPSASRSAGLRTPGNEFCNGRIMSSPSRSRGDLPLWKNALFNLDLMAKPSTDLAGERVISREVARERDGRLRDFERVGAMDYHSRAVPMDRQYSIPASAADKSLRFHPYDDRVARLSQRDSPTHKFHWRSESSPNITLWKGASSTPGSPTRPPTLTAPDFGFGISSRCYT